MEDFLLKENVIYSYRTFFARSNPQARLIARRFLVMVGFSILLFVV